MSVVATEGKKSGEAIFALDIGTHSVIGVVGHASEQLLHIDEICQLEYPRRAMRDGQIEDIETVSKVAGKARDELELRTGVKLSNVYIAAAGRALRSQRASFELTLDEEEMVRRHMVAELELGAIQRAEEMVFDSAKEDELHLYYIGHSVVQYYLDDYPLSNLLDHKGKRLQVEIIATFLPGQVLESLHMAMKKIGLTVSNVTLEPIAAMNAIIPNELRMLNLVLVDIGAGTSDIAVSENGSVAAYTMATIAGDEITEAIVQEFLVDFKTAEEMKMALSQKVNPIPYQDILGLSYSVEAEQLHEKIQPTIETLCNEICSRIMEVNGKAPSAVFLVGGGSKLLGLAAMLAQRLGIDERKVAVGGNNYMKRMVESPVDITGPEYATPVGIALTALMAQNEGKYSVMLNEKEILLSSSKPANLMDLLVLQGYERTSLLGRAGKSVTFELDGRKKVVRGGHPTAAVLTINDRPASITTPVRPNDQITLVPSIPGSDAVITIREAVTDFKLFEILVNGQARFAGTLAYRNGVQAAPDQRIEDLDVVQVHELDTLHDLCREAGLDEEQFHFTVNGVTRELDCPLTPGDEVEYISAAQEARARARLAALNPATPPPPTTLPSARSIRVTLNGAERMLTEKPDKSSYQFLDMLNFIDIDPQHPRGDIVLRLNHRAASYLDEIFDGDVIEIYWSGM